MFTLEDLDEIQIGGSFGTKEKQTYPFKKKNMSEV